MKSFIKQYSLYIILCILVCFISPEFGVKLVVYSIVMTLFNYGILYYVKNIWNRTNTFVGYVCVFITIVSNIFAIWYFFFFVEINL